MIIAKAGYGFKKVFENFEVTVNITVSGSEIFHEKIKIKIKPTFRRMMMNVKTPFLVLLVTLSLFCSKKEQDAKGEEPEKTASLLKDKYEVIIIMDTIDEWSKGIRDGFKETLNKHLKSNNAKAKYSEFDTELKPARVPSIIKAIKDKKPDLICVINFPNVFADRMITKKLNDPQYKFVSENCIPVKSGVIKSWKKPGGNITGVGVFLQMISQIRIMKKINPRANNLIFYTWDAMTQLNEWFEQEIRRACKEENIKLTEFKRVSSIEDEILLFKKYAHKGKDYFLMGGISAFVHRDGREVKNLSDIENKWLRKYSKIPEIVYDETAIKHGMLGGASVIWYDIGAQLAEKGIRVLQGENPGEIPWDYPRKYNIILNKKRAEDLGIKIPQELINASYRIYTDYKGNFIGQGK
jgi:putative tryptophan/tyrosine transport system substrate-binding protein